MGESTLSPMFDLWLLLIGPKPEALIFKASPVFRKQCVLVDSQTEF